jgi:branched-chain amino acid transport system ATP-binding protein
MAITRADADGPGVCPPPVRRRGGLPTGLPATAGRVAAWVAGTLILWAVLARVLAKGLPPGIVVLGVIYGSLYALVAIGIVLVYRANRIINFAQAQLGVVAAILAIELHVTYGVSYVLSCLAGIAAAIVLGALISLLPRHFRKSSRLILTVATIALAQTLTGLATIVPLWFCDPAKNQACLTATRNQSFNTPLNAHFSIYPVIFMGNDVVALVGAAAFVVALTLFLRYSKYGVAIRAAADNGDRAMLLGIPVPRLDTIVWCLAAVLSAAAVLLRVPVLGFGGFQTVSGGGDELLLFTLAAAVIGRMESMPRTAVAAIAIGIYQSLVTWTFANTTFVDATLALVIVVALLAQRDAYRRVSNALGSTWRDIAAVRPIPRQLAQLGEVRWSGRVIKLGLLAAAAALPAVLSGSQTYLAALILIYAIVGLSLLVLTGWAGQISLGQFALAGVGGATTAVLFQRHGWDFLLALAAGVVVGALTALLIGVPALRIQGPFLAVTTLAFALGVSTYFLNPANLPWFVTVQISRPTILGANVLDADWQIYYLCLVSFLVVMLAVRSLRRSRIGRALIATRDNEAATSAAALNTTRMKLTAFLISGGIAGFAGAIFVVHQRGVNSGSFNADISIALFLMVVVGGAGSLPGVVIGAIYVWGTQYYLHGGFSLVASGLGILILLIVLPEGLGGLLYQLRDRLLRELARRKNIPLSGAVVPAAEPSGQDRGATAILEDAQRSSPRDPSRTGPRQPVGRLTGGPTPDGSQPGATADGSADPAASRGPRSTGRALLPLIVVTGLAAMAQLNALALVLLLPDLRGSFHSGLFFVSTIAVVGIQVGLLLDVGIGGLANRVRRMRLLCAGMGLVAVCSVLVVVAGRAQSVVLLDVATAAVAVAGWAFTSTQNSLLADHYPPEVRPRVHFIQRAGIAGALALGPALVGALEIFYRWQVPFLVLAVPTLVLVALGLLVRGPTSREWAGAPRADAEEPPSFAEAIRVLFAKPSIRRLYYSLPFLAVLIVGMRHFADLLYRNVFHLSAGGRALVFALVEPSTFVGLVVGLIVVPRLMARDLGRAVRLVSYAAVGAAACLAAMALAPNVAWAAGAQFTYGLAAAWLLASIYTAVSVAAPPRMVPLAFALTSLWFGFGVGVIAPAGLSLISTVNGLAGYRGGFYVYVALLLIGSRVLASATRSLNRDVEQLRITALADAEILRSRAAGRAQLLMVRSLDAGYDGLQVLFGVDLDVDDGELVAILGTNGAGKSTLLRAISGLNTATAGEVIFDGRDITTVDAARVVSRGIVQVPGGRGIFAGLSVAENLRAAAWQHNGDGHDREDVTEVALGRFPVLRDRWDVPAGSLSGGEQQMLSLALAFLARPRLLMIDELSLGLAPVVIDMLIDVVDAIHESGTTVILVEQSVNLALRLAGRAVFMERGQVRFTGATSELADRDDLIRAVFLDGARPPAPSDEPAGPTRVDAGPRRAAASTVPDGVVLASSGLRRRFGGVTAVDGVSLELHAGEILGLVGPNGAGKTTLFELLSGHLAPDRGRVRMFGADVTEWPAHRRAAAGLGRSFQSARLWPGLTVGESLALAASKRLHSPGVLASLLGLPTVRRAERQAERAADEVIEMFGLGDYRDYLTADLSTGTRRLVELAVLVAMRPSILLLDEPSAGTAQSEALALVPVLRDTTAWLSCSTIVVEHDIALVRALADRVAAMDTGSIVAVGSPDDVFRHPRVVEAYLGATPH